MIIQKDHRNPVVKDKSKSNHVLITILIVVYLVSAFQFYKLGIDKGVEMTIEELELMAMESKAK